MPINEVTIVRKCASCRYEFGTMTVKKDNMRLMTSELAWCEHCGADSAEIREIADRATTVAAEQASYPGNPAVDDVSSAEFRRRRGVSRGTRESGRER